MRDTLRFAIPSCGACCRGHELTVVYTGASSMQDYVPASSEPVELEYTCPVKETQATCAAVFESAMEDPKVVAVRNV